jgi:hypothetical protein
MQPKRIGAAYSGAVEVSPGVWGAKIIKNGLPLQLTRRVRNTTGTMILHALEMAIVFPDF